MNIRALLSSHRALARLDGLQARLSMGDHTHSIQALQFFDRHHPDPAKLMIQTVSAARRCESEMGWEGPIYECVGREQLLDDVEQRFRHGRGVSAASNLSEEQELLNQFPPELLHISRRNTHNNGVRASDKTLAVAYFALGVPEHPKWAIEWFVCDTTSRTGIKTFGTQSARRLEMLLQPWRAILAGLDSPYTF